jgi:hypothetical protein
MKEAVQGPSLCPCTVQTLLVPFASKDAGSNKSVGYTSGPPPNSKPTMPQSQALVSGPKSDATAARAKLDEELAAMEQWIADGLSKGYLWGPNTGHKLKTVSEEPTGQ